MNTPQQKVVLLHGIWRSSKSMFFIERYLRRRGYEVLNLDYPSTRLPLEALIETVHPRIAEFSNGATTHFVCHSMGGLVIRAYLSRHRPVGLGKVVMLGTPNHGSEVADFIKGWRAYRHCFGPAGQQLTTNQSAIAHLFSGVDYPLGIIAGDTSLDVVCKHIIGKPSDGKVSIESTKLEGMSAHCVVPVSHLMLTYSRRVNRLIAQFLAEGKFLRGRVDFKPSPLRERVAKP